jgi:N-acetylneuraminate synthase
MIYFIMSGGKMKRTHIIAEIGINHNGDLETAKKLINVANVAGCDSVKFQKRNPDVCVPEYQKNILRQTPWGEMKYIDYKHRMEFGKEEFDEIDAHCKEVGIAWSASAWDLDSLQFLEQYDLPYIKIASAMLTNSELINAARETGKKIILSTGMSTVDEVIRAVSILEKDGNKNYALLHCNSSYPAPLEELNLSAIKTLRAMFGCEVGYSGHEYRLDSNVHTVSAIYLGATIIERHITLDRTMWGTDQSCSVEPQGLIKLVKGVRELELSYGTGEIGVTESEKPVRLKLRGD